MIKRRYFTILEVLISLTLSAFLLTSLLFFYRYLTELSAKADQIEIQNFQARAIETRLAEVFYSIVGEDFQADSSGQPAPSTAKPQDKGKAKEKDPANPQEPPKQDNPDDKTAKKNNEKAVVFFGGVEEGGALKDGSATLTFIFHNGASMNTVFSNEVLAKLFVDTQNRLCLALWPHPKFWSNAAMPPMNLEVLMEHVDKLALHFYVPPVDPNDKEEEDVKYPEMRPGEWIPQWLREYEQLPAMIKLDLTFITKEKEEKVVTFAYPLIDGSKVIEYRK